ncbi:protein turtle B-like protein [Dinothrombium tinctorium]|uniref:Protein turtle B-like protein n=1 Tax=Dinothrombium tinctorium TaxID=1965070 RepID=A0A3S3R1D6_9ACAR|nr:protein turtle B-like protein [Dinothrombium tinctorium]
MCLLSASIVYTAVVRGKVALPCDVTPPTSDDSVALILWYKDEALTPIYTLDARKGILEQARTLTASPLEGRAYFNLNNRPAFLQIDPVRLIDAGDYRCRVDFKKARTVNTVISLKVIVTPEEPKIFDLEGNELKGLIGPYNEGEELKLICTTVGGKPRPSLTWWRDYQILDDTFEYGEKDLTRNQLTISSLARHHLLSIFTCQAINNNVTVPLSTTITIDLNLKPQQVHITQLTPKIVADKAATFECKAFGSRPKAILYWLFAGEKHNTPLSGDHHTSTKITLTPQQTHNGQHLKCVAENSKIPRSSISDELKLDVHYIPQLTLKLGSPTISLHSIQEGNDIYFDCHIDANPWPIKPIIWRFNENVIHQKQGVIQTNQSLVLQRVSRGQSGMYQCEASNQLGIALSNKIDLKIRYAPVCKTNFIRIYGVSLHETVELKCDVDANPTQVTFQWKFQSDTDLISFYNMNDTSSTLHYTPRSSQDFGNIQCMAKNEVGLQQKPCTFSIILGGPPEFPFTCHIINQSDNALVIQCLHNIHTKQRIQQQEQQSIYVYPKTNYVCEVYTASNDYLVANVTANLAVSSHSYLSKSDQSNFLHFVVNNLQAATNFILKLYSINSKGKSKISVLKGQTLRPAERLIYKHSTNGSNASDIYDGAYFLLKDKAILIAVLTAIVIVSLIVIVLGLINAFRVNRLRSRCNQQSPMQSQPQQPPDSAATLFNEDEEDCCCDDECCDEMLLTSTVSEQQQCNAKGPPDIIPSFGYQSSGLENKQFVNYGDYPQELHRGSERKMSSNYVDLSFNGFIPGFISSNDVSLKFFY